MKKGETVEVRGNLKDGLGEPFISRSAILEKIEACLDRAEQKPDTVNDGEHIVQSIYVADQLIEFLEVADCGSYGGFGLKKTPKGMVKQEDLGHYTLRERYDWLKSMPLRKSW